MSSKLSRMHSEGLDPHWALFRKTDGEIGKKLKREKGNDILLGMPKIFNSGLFRNSRVLSK